MANTGYSSPFPTSHDTIGASTLATPLFMPSSPPGPDPDDMPMDSPERAKSRVSDRVAKKINEEDEDDEFDLQRFGSPVSSRAASPDGAARALDARLADYTVDFDRFHSGQFDDDKEAQLPELKDPEEDKLSEVGGPEDFTANLERYLLGEDEESKREVERDELSEIQEQEELDEQEHEQEQQEREKQEWKEQRQEEQEKVQLQQEDSKLHQPAVEDEPELGEYSEFGPPMDMSTPSHLLRRHPGLGKDITHLEGIEEDPAHELDTAMTPSVRKQKAASVKAEQGTDSDLHQQIDDLQRAVQDRDEQLQRNHRRFLEATSAREQIKHLQMELHRKTALLDELHAQRSDEALLREHIRTLQQQNTEKEQALQRTINASDITGLQKQIGDMQKELQNRNSPTDMDAERLETIAHLRQQLNLAQDQLKKRDASLEETIAKLREVTSAKEQQLREKNTEIDGLKAQNDDHLLEVEKLERDLERANKDYQTLESRIASLETKNRPLEEKNSTLEADLTRAQTQVTAQENALKAMAADLPAGGNTYTEILELIKDLGPGDIESVSDSFTKERDSRASGSEVEQLCQELSKLQAEFKEVSAARSTLESELKHSREQATEAQSLIHSIEGENTRLTKRADELRASLDKSQYELCRIREERSHALGTIERLEQSKAQQLSPPPTPPTARSNQQNALEATHQAQIKSLQSAHTTAISNLRTAHADSTRKLRNLLAAAEKRESKLKADLQSFRDSHSAQESLNTEIQRLESIIAAKDETAATMDQRIARTVEKREKEWERRIDLLLKERDRMAKALMWTWGEKEVGDVKEDTLDENGRKQSKQGYRYKYAKSGGRRA